MTTNLSVETSVTAFGAVRRAAVNQLLFTIKLSLNV